MKIGILSAGRTGTHWFYSMIQPLTGGRWEEFLHQQSPDNIVSCLNAHERTYGLISFWLPGSLVERFAEQKAHKTVDYWIRFRRRDTIAQAVSYVRATQSGRWYLHQVDTNKPYYSYEEIQGTLKTQQRFESIYDQFIGAVMLKRSPFTIYYEDLQRNPLGYVESVWSMLGKPVATPIRSLETEEWCTRFREGDRS